MNLTPQKIRKLIEIAYAIEPLLDKKDCTTRYVDLPDKPLTDFIIAGINVGSVFEDYAKDVLNNKSKRMFSHISKAIEASDDLKTKKYISLGLLEPMFVTLKARIDCPKLKDFFTSSLSKTLDNTTNQDVLDCLEGFRLAISTSTNKHKQEHIDENYKYLSESKNIKEMYKRWFNTIPDENKAGHQVAHQYINGFPIIKRYVENIDEQKGLIKSIEDSYNKMHIENPEIKIGILADLSASAIFLYLSYRPEDYIIR